MSETIRNCDTCEHGHEHADPACFNCATWLNDVPHVFKNWMPKCPVSTPSEYITPLPNLIIDFSALTLRDYFGGIALQGFLAGSPDSDCGYMQWTLIVKPMP